MNKRILPFYLTGWFYLALVFWLAALSYVSNGGLNSANQINLKLLTKIFPDNATQHNRSLLTPTDILTLHANFDEDNVTAIQSLLSQQPDSQIVILGKPTKAFISKLDSHLAKKARTTKILVNSNYEFSESPIKISDLMFFSSVLNWFRFNENTQAVQAKSNHFIFSPLLLNQRQSFPLFWQHQGELYPSLLTEILQQLNSNNLTLKQRWQLSLDNPKQSLADETFIFGFYGEVFTIGNSYLLDQGGNLTGYAKDHFLISNSLNNNTDDSTGEGSYITSVQQFITKDNNSYSKPADIQQYSIIILTDKLFEKDEIVNPLLIKLTQGDYLSQSLLTILLCGLLGIIGLALIWLIQHLSFKKQLSSIVVYVIILFTLQSLMFNQQQWLEVLPVFLIIVGTWALFFAYHKEDSLLVTSLIRQAEKLKGTSSPATVIAKHIATNQKRPGYKSPQNFSPTATMTSNPVDELDKTMVMGSPALQGKQINSHHITVENFGRYQVEGVLGKGAMGIVYQGVDPKINRHVAIKTLQLTSDVNSEEASEAKERFFREAQTAGGLSHANIVTIYDVGEENNLGYIAMDLLTGAPLSLFTQPGQTLPTPLVYQLLIQITDALEYAHNQKVVHRDIKPANIIFDDDLIKVTVTDFGIAYVSDHSKTRTGVIMGSPYYMSPEQILGLKVDGRSDIFSLGVTFYQLLSGHLPFEGESIATVAYQITKTKPIAVNSHNDELPASALRITNKAMHKDIDKRYQSMAEFKLALVNALKRDYKITAN